MNVSCVWVDELGQGVYIGVEEFLQPSVVQYFIDDGTLASQLLQNFLARHILSCFGLLGLVYDLHFPKEDFAYLSGGGYVERLACQLIDVVLYFGQSIGQID